MTKRKLYHLKNEMLVANFLANFIGVFGVNALLISAGGFPYTKILTYPIPSPDAYVRVPTRSMIYKDVNFYLSQNSYRHAGVVLLI